MHILVLASGSGGHVYPALSFVNKATQHKITYLRIKNGFESKILDDSLPYLDVKNQLKSYIKHPREFFKLRKEIKRNKDVLKEVDAIVCFGGFVSFIGLIISLMYNKPLYLHEQNKTLGDANKIAQFHARKIFVCFESSILNPKNKKYMFVGNPRMDEVKGNKHDHLGFNVLFFAGSLSSSSLNNIVKELLEKNIPSKINFYVITGEKQFKEFSSLKKNNVHILSYQKDMISLMRNMDLVIMRAGATSISEVIAFNLPAILIPSPNVKHNHQYENAYELAKSNAAILIEEKDCTSEKLYKEIEVLFKDYTQYLVIKNNLKKFYKEDVCKNMLKVINNERL
ncbi:MAG: UDP-N-acetylglucosamine--N-acetylmuramyl-(pentapeptide) pyrophosphoryl-undecaprenol N-acetylglucosamine transferase [Erysipelotrichales bacterium]|nr:UDP-N-acetylglucosamine--N-acetylmuramyl-(pentapeptide) pyrophosphoryl-undecaprenol N-acetylglucosamine transferase [Erysipelotrichales bacterium]